MDVIAINDQAPHLDKLVDVIHLYMNLQNWGRRELADYTVNETLKNAWKTINKVMRIRRRLHGQRRLYERLCIDQTRIRGKWIFGCFFPN